jgi:multicomponent Na+:H+ antiporter subunit G
MRDVITAALLVVGTILFISASIGLLRFPSPYARLHAASKATTLGLVCLVLAAVFQLTEPRYTAKLLIVVLFQVSTVPIASHVMARTAHRRRTPLSTPDAVNEWTEPEEAET